jgi:AcrR family transcriptional regulator
VKVRAGAPGGGGRGRPRSQAAEDAILDATLALLAEAGFRGMTVEAVATRAGASKATIYRRWPTKENLVIAAFARTPDLVLRGGADLAAQLVDTLGQFARFMQDTPLGGVLPALAAESAHNPALEAAFTPLVHQRRRPIVTLFERARAAGSLPAHTDPEFAADLVTAPVLQRIMVMGRRTDRRYIRRVVDTALRGLRAED